jgi:hypothetical protein
LSLATNAVISATDTVLSALGKLQAQITGLSSIYVALTGNQTVAGVKTFSSDPLIPDEAYNATAWNSVLEPPTKNAVRDQIETMLATEPRIIGDEVTLAQRKNSSLSLFDGFDGATLPAGFAWAGAPFVTPSTADVSVYPSFLKLSHTVAYRGFLYRTTITVAGTHPTIIVGFQAGTGFAGLRMDDGTDNNYFEWLLSTDLKGTIRTRTGGGAVATVQGASMVIPQLYGIRAVRTGTLYSSWGATTWLTMPWQGALIQQVQAASALTTASWTPTRMGIVTDMSSANASVLIDAILEF